MGTNGDQSTEEYGLFDSLGREWIKLPTAAMREVGPAAQTLGGLLKVTNRETFAAVSKIAGNARLPTKTTRNHLTSLTEAGWIVNAGRERTRRGAPRRTCTIRVTKKTVEAIRPAETADDLLYGVLPWWASGGMPWCARAVLSVVMARLMASKAAIVEQEGKADLSTDDWWGSLENLGGEDRFRFSLIRLEELTGLDHKSIIRAKRKLQELKVIRWYGCKREDGGDDKHMLYPNEAFRVVVKPTTNNRCIVSFRGDGKNGH
jgi:hypothetical protein